jgi:hypothetical protein
MNPLNTELLLNYFQMTTFGQDVRQALFCLLQYSQDYAEAAEVGYLIEDLVEAGLQRIRLTKADHCP